MKSTPLPFLTLALLTAAATSTAAEKEIVIRHSAGGDAPRHVFVSKHGGEAKKEKVAFLGVQTAPAGRALAAQLGLPADTGLVVNEVVDDSPAAAVLKEHDVLTKFNDQLLIDQHQLSVLVRQKKEGEEVTLTLIRGGKETTVKVKLGQREVPVVGMFNLEVGSPEGRPGFQWFGGDLQGLARLRELPGLEPGAVNDVVRVIGNARAHVLEAPGVHMLSRAGRGATILDLPKGNIVYSDDDGAVEVTAGDGKRDLKVTDAQGKVLFEGPVVSKEDREKLPAEIRERIHRIEKASLSFEVGDDFRFEGADVRPAPPAPEKIRLRHPPVPGDRPLRAL